jgi:hypothetical protein
MLLRYLRLSAAALGLVILAPAAASANSYLVTSCSGPLGEPNAAVGWNPTSSPGGFTTNNCQTPDGVLKAALTDTNPPGTASASFRFDAPPGTTIVRMTGRRTTTGMSASNQRPDVQYLLTAPDGQVLEECAPGPGSSCVADLAGALDKQGLNAAWIEFRVLCGDAGRTCTRPVSVQATKMWPTLEDPTAPVVANPQLIDDGDRTGTLRVRYDATDVGGGLYRTIVKVDGKLAQIAPLGAAPCVDANPSDSDPFQFTVPVPCPATVNGAEAVVQASSFGDGLPHGIEMAVQDAAGNETPVFGPVVFPKTNSGTTGASSTPAQLANIRNATLKMWFVKARHHGRRYTSKLGMRVVTRGVLRGKDGRGIQGARIDVYHRRKGKPLLLKTGLKSRAHGQLTLILPLNVDTRTIEFAYRALRPGSITSRQRLHLTVLRNGKVYHRK